MTEQNAETWLAASVRAARLSLGWGYEEAARRAGISSITWRRVEDGLRVQEPKLAAMEKALGWAPGQADRILRGLTEPVGPGAEDAGFVADRGPDDQASAITDEELLAEIRRVRAEFDGQLDMLERRLRDRSVGGSE